MILDYLAGEYCEKTVDGVWYGKAELNLQRYGTGKIIKGFSHCEEQRSRSETAVPQDTLSFSAEVTQPVCFHQCTVP